MNTKNMGDCNHISWYSGCQWCAEAMIESGRICEYCDNKATHTKAWGESMIPICLLCYNVVELKLHKTEEEKKQILISIRNTEYVKFSRYEANLIYDNWLYKGTHLEHRMRNLPNSTSF